MSCWTIALSKKSQLCSSYYILKSYYPFLNHSFNKELEIRKSSNKAFVDEELAVLLYEQTDILSFLQRQNVCQGDIRPHSIFLVKDEDKVATLICDRMSQGSLIQTQLNHVIMNRPLYMAPILFENLNLGRTNFVHNHFKSDAFSLGMLLLEAGTLTSVQSIYNKESSTINEVVLQRLIEAFAKRYENSTWLIGTVRKLLEIEEHDRFDFLELRESLPPREVVDQYYRQLRMQ